MNTTESKQVCRITITFPVESDDKAIEYKKKIASLMAESDESQIQFSLMNIPKGLDELALQREGRRSVD